jgi:polyhydroxyalkanoate synthesis regulator phasin
MAGILGLIGALAPMLLEIIRFMMAKGMMRAETSRKFLDAIHSYQKESGNFSVKMRMKYEQMVAKQLELEANEVPKNGT